MQCASGIEIHDWNEVSAQARANVISPAKFYCRWISIVAIWSHSMAMVSVERQTPRDHADFVLHLLVFYPVCRSISSIVHLLLMPPQFRLISWNLLYGRTPNLLTTRPNQLTAENEKNEIFTYIEYYDLSPSSLAQDFVAFWPGIRRNHQHVGRSARILLFASTLWIAAMNNHLHSNRFRKSTEARN